MGMDILIDNLFPLDSWEPDFQANYSGSERKTGLFAPDGFRYMVKYTERQEPRNSFAGEFVNNALSEYMASHALGILGYCAHETFLGTIGGKPVVACLNFVPDGAELVEFEKFMRRHYDSSEIGKLPDIKQICEIMKIDPVLSPKSGDFLSHYWELFVADALVGNFDRHMGNFGYLVFHDGSVSEASVYDNGSAFYPRLSDGGMKAILSSPREIMMRVLLFPKSALVVNGKKADYRDMMVSGISDGLVKAVLNIVPEIERKLPDVCGFIKSCDFISETRKNFYNTLLLARMKFILEPAYKACLSSSHKDFDLDARERLASGKEYSLKFFDNDWHEFHKIWEKELDSIREQVEKLDVNPCGPVYL